MDRLPTPLTPLWQHLEVSTLAQVALDLYYAVEQEREGAKVALDNLNDYMRQSRDSHGHTRWAHYCDEIEEQTEDKGVMLDITG